jgi:hypothetical protein
MDYWRTRCARLGNDPEIPGDVKAALTQEASQAGRTALKNTVAFPPARTADQTRAAESNYLDSPARSLQCGHLNYTVPGWAHSNVDVRTRTAAWRLAAPEIASESLAEQRWAHSVQFEVLVVLSSLTVGPPVIDVVGPGSYKVYDARPIVTRQICRD